MPRADLLPGPRWPRRRWLALAILASAAVAVTGVVVPPALWNAATPVRDVEPTPVPPAPPTAEAELRVRPLVDWLREVALEAGLGLVVSPEIDAEITAVFPQPSPWPERLDALARIGGFSYRVGPSMIEVWAAATEARGNGMADLEALPTTTGGGAGNDEPAPCEPAPVGLQPASAPVEPPPIARVIRLSNARAVDVEQVLSDSVSDAVARVAADPASNALVLAGPVADVTVLERVARALDVPKRSFLLEAQIVEIKRSSRDERGVEWLLQSGDAAGLVDFPAADSSREQSGVIVATSGSHSLRARISALAASGRARVVSQPRVIVVEGKAASIESVRVLRVRVPERGAVVADGDDISVSSDARAVEEIPVGVSLIVEPALQGQGRIVLRIRAESSTLGPPLPPDDIPEELSRVVDAEIVLGNGETAVLGGLRREARSSSGAGVPVLRSVPVLGALFGKRRDEHDGEELVVLVTPRLLG